MEEEETAGYHHRYRYPPHARLLDAGACDAGSLRDADD